MIEKIFKLLKNAEVTEIISDDNKVKGVKLIIHNLLTAII